MNTAVFKNLPVAQAVELPSLVANRDGEIVSRTLAQNPHGNVTLFAFAAGEAISRSSLLKNVWGYENSGDTRLVNVHVQRLRAKVEDDPENPQIVQTVRGIGYKFVTPEQ